MILMLIGLVYLESNGQLFFCFCSASHLFPGQRGASFSLSRGVWLSLLSLSDKTTSHYSLPSQKPFRCGSPPWRYGHSLCCLQKHILYLCEAVNNSNVINILSCRIPYLQMQLQMQRRSPFPLPHLWHKYHKEKSFHRSLKSLYC